MANFSKLSSIGSLAIAGAGLGLYLGSSAVSEINPAYFSTPTSSKFHTDLVPNPGERDRDRDRAQPLSEMAEVATDVGSTCVSCSLSPNEYAVINYPSADNHNSFGPPSADLVLAQAEEYVSQGLSPSEARDIERYAHFQVSDDEMGAAPAVPSSRDAEDDPAVAQEEEEAAPGS